MACKSIFVIFDKDHGGFWTAGNKVAWKSTAAAKNAYALRHHGEFKKDSHKFDDQNQYKIIEITDDGRHIELQGKE